MKTLEYQIIEEYEKKVLSPEYREKFDCYFHKLVEYNKMFNLTSILEEKEVFLKHFVDSVIGEFLFEKNKSVVEIGSGAGFPSLPLKIVREDLSFDLVESTGKKCEFLRIIVDNLGLKGVNIHNSRAEDLAKDPSYREKFDFCTARAVARMNTLSEYCLPFVKKGGCFIAYKGDSDEEVKQSQRAFSLLGGKIKEVYDYDLFQEGKRSLVVVEKRENTPQKYPRGNGKERKNPL